MITIYGGDDCPRCKEAVEDTLQNFSDVLLMKIGDDPVEHFDKCDIMTFLQMNGSQLPVIQVDDKLMTLEDFKCRLEEG